MKPFIKFLIISAAMTALYGCASNEADARWQKELAAANAEGATCREDYPIDRQHIVQRIKCIN